LGIRAGVFAFGGFRNLPLAPSSRGRSGGSGEGAGGHDYVHGGGGGKLVVFGDFEPVVPPGAAFGVVEDEGGDAELVAEGAEEVEGLAGGPAVVEGAAGGGAVEGVDDDELDVGFVGPEGEEVDGGLLVDGEAFVGGEEGDGGVGEGAAADEAVAVPEGLFLGEPEDAALVARHAGEGGPGGDGEGQGGGEAGFALLWRCGEDHEAAEGNEVLDEPRLLEMVELGLDGVEDAAVLVVGGFGLAETFFGGEGEVGLRFGGHLQGGHETGCCQPGSIIDTMWSLAQLAQKQFLEACQKSNVTECHPSGGFGFRTNGDRKAPGRLRLTTFARIARCSSVNSGTS